MTEKDSINLDAVDFEFSREINMAFNTAISQISILESEFMGRESILHIFDHEQESNILDQAMLVSELDVLNEGFIQDSQISLNLSLSQDRNQTTLQSSNSILPNLRSLTLDNN